MGRDYSLHLDLRVVELGTKTSAEKEGKKTLEITFPLFHEDLISTGKEESIWGGGGAGVCVSSKM